MNIRLPAGPIKKIFPLNSRRPFLDVKYKTRESLKCFEEQSFPDILFMRLNPQKMGGASRHPGTRTEEEEVRKKEEEVQKKSKEGT